MYGYNTTSVKKLMSEIYTSKEIMALRVGPIPEKCNASNHGIDHNDDIKREHVA